MGSKLDVPECREKLKVSFASMQRGKRAGEIIATYNLNQMCDLYDADEVVNWCRNLDPKRRITPNKYKIKKSLVVIIASSGEEILCDKEDFDDLKKYTWSIQRRKKKNGEVKMYATSRGESGRGITMHRLIMGFPEGLTVDHKNNNGLDNRRSNLRIATLKQNIRNRPLQSNNTSGYKGVTWSRQAKKWKAGIGVDGKARCLGFHDTKEEAARAYNEGAIKYFGEFALLNNL